MKLGRVGSWPNPSIPQNKVLTHRDCFTWKNSNSLSQHFSSVIVSPLNPMPEPTSDPYKTRGQPDTVQGIFQPNRIKMEKFGSLREIGSSLSNILQVPDKLYPALFQANNLKIKWKYLESSTLILMDLQWTWIRSISLLQPSSNSSTSSWSLSSRSIVRYWREFRMTHKLMKNHDFFVLQDQPCPGHCPEAHQWCEASTWRLSRNKPGTFWRPELFASSHR